MSGTTNLDIPFLTEHFKYTPIALLDDIINSVNIISSRAVEAVEKGLLEADPAILGFKTGSLPESVQTEIEDGVHKLETLLEATIDKNFDIFELFSLRNMLGVPAELRPWVRLNHYEGLNFNLSEDAPTTESTMLLRRKVQETVRLHLHLLAETKRRAALIQELRALISSNPAEGGVAKIEPSESSSPSSAGVFAFLQEKGDLGKSSVNNTTAFALAQLPGLRKLVTDLRPKMVQLSKEGAAAGGNKARRERVDYVEKETKKILERQGLELDEQGAVRDGEWQGPGRKFAEGELEALEGVVGLIGGEIGKNGHQGGDNGDQMDEST